MNMLSIENSVLFLVDVQEKLVAALEKNTVVKKSNILLQTANILDIPSIITEQYPQGLGKTVDYLAEHIKNNTTVMEKSSFSALAEEEILNKLKSLDKKQVIIGGIEAHICVYQTVADLISNGFEVYVVKDACASRKKDDFKSGIKLMEQNGAKITATEAVVFELLKTSKNPHFKEVQALVK